MNTFLIEGGHPLKGSVQVSGNKNEALPALAATLLTDETVILKRMPKIQDVLTLCKILEKLGAKTEWITETELSVSCKNVHSHKPDPELCSKIRASILLIGPLLSRFGKIELALPGGDVIGTRRIDTHFECIEALGGKLNFGHPITGSLSKVTGAEVFLDEPSVTATENAILLAVLGSGTTVLHNAASEPHIVGLCKLLNAMGGKISGIGSNRLTILGVTSLKGAEHEIGPDFMEVGSFLCLGAVSDSDLTIENVCVEELRFILKTFSRLGIYPEIEGQNLKISHSRSQDPIAVRKDIGGRIPSIYSGPWPAFPTDLMSVAIVAATQARGTVIFHEKMYEGRMFFTDKLMAMGAEIVLCDPHRIVVSGPAQLQGAALSSPDVRAGMALLMAALLAKGKSEIHNIYQIERGYFNIAEKLTQLGAVIKKSN